MDPMCNLLFYPNLFSAICKDTNSNCENWAASGECERNPAWMLPNRPRSCHQCGDTTETTMSTTDQPIEPTTSTELTSTTDQQTQPSTVQPTTGILSGIYSSFIVRTQEPARLLQLQGVTEYFVPKESRTGQRVNSGREAGIHWLSLRDMNPILIYYVP